MKLLMVIIALSLAACTPNQAHQYQSEQSLELTGNQENVMTDTAQPQQELVQARLTTTRGEILLELNPNNAPTTVANFISKAKSGYYENLTFHRVEDWVVQGGDPQGTGMGGGKMDTELSQQPFTTGSLGVARGGDIRVSNDSQFFICTQECNWLTGQYTHFGHVVEGMDVVNSLQIGDTIESIEIVES